MFDRGANDRTPGTMIDDEFIERIAAREINKSDPVLKAANINMPNRDSINPNSSISLLMIKFAIFDMNFFISINI